MRNLCGDLALVATVAQIYGVEDAAQNFYCLAQYGCNLGATMDPGDLAVGLDLTGVESFRLTAPGQEVPNMVGFALENGHVVLAQVKGDVPIGRCTWVALTSGDRRGWAGIMVGWDMVAHGISSRMGYELTGHYVITHPPIPGWEPEA